MRHFGSAYDSDVKPRVCGISRGGGFGAFLLSRPRLAHLHRNTDTLRPIAHATPVRSTPPGATSVTTRKNALDAPRLISGSRPGLHGRRPIVQAGAVPFQECRACEGTFGLGSSGGGQRGRQRQPATLPSPLPPPPRPPRPSPRGIARARRLRATGSCPTGGARFRAAWRPPVGGSFSLG